MPRPGLPLTPNSSSDIKGKDGTQQLSSFQLSFELPPPAMHDASRVSPPDTQLSPTSTRSSAGMTFPTQPAETVKARRRSSAAKETKDSNTFALPPPPTRSRKIIQMKPRTHDEAGDNATTSKETAKAGGRGAVASRGASKTASGSGAAAGEQGKKKQPSATSAAGRKIARKTAHSLIERRRRSKMNEEFAVLKGLIPACSGDMHKLSILQAAIEYVRYLQDCVTKLQVQQSNDQARGESEAQASSATRERLPSIREFHPSFKGDPMAEMDVDMSESDAVSPTLTEQPDDTTQTSFSPALAAQETRHRQHSYSSVSTDRRHYSFSAGTSPAFGPQPYAGGYARSDASGPPSTLTSPALHPQTEGDQEAMTALLMLNNDRRGARGSGNTRGLSVRDLLSNA